MACGAAGGSAGSAGATGGAGGSGGRGGSAGLGVARRRRRRRQLGLARADARRCSPGVQRRRAEGPRLRHRGVRDGSGFSPRGGLRSRDQHLDDEGEHPFPSDYPNVAATADKIYILGEVGNTNSAEYDPVTNTWTMKAPIPTQRAASATAAIGTKVYVAGGAMGSNGASFGPTVRDFAVYDTVTNTWETLDPMPAPGRNHAPGVAANGIFYVIGGRTNGPMDGLQNRVDAYDPVAKTWTPKTPMPVARGGCMGGLVNGQIIIVGGEGNPRDVNVNGVFPDTDGYDPIADVWHVYAPMRTPRHGTGAAGVGNKLYVPGGATAQGGGTAVAILEAFTLP